VLIHAASIGSRYCCHALIVVVVLLLLFLLLLIRLSVGPAGNPPSTSAVEAVCIKPSLFSSPVHLQRREKPLLAKGGIMGEKWPVKFSQTIPLPRNF
jgi:hypothetical protein